MQPIPKLDLVRTVCILGAQRRFEGSDVFWRNRHQAKLPPNIENLRIPPLARPSCCIMGVWAAFLSSDGGWFKASALSDLRWSIFYAKWDCCPQT